MVKITPIVISGIIFGGFANLMLPPSFSRILVILVALIGGTLGSLDWFVKIYEFFIDSPKSVEIKTWRRVITGLLLGMFFSVVIVIMEQDFTLATNSLPIFFVVGFSKIPSRIIINILKVIKHEREENERRREEERANQPIVIHVDGGHRHYEEDGLKSPRELTQGYKASKRRAEKEYKQKDNDMRGKIW